MKHLVCMQGLLLLLGSFAFTAHAAFSSIYIFGDSVSTTLSNQPSASFYGRRESNGRVWVEVLAQRQGLGATSLTSTNWNFSSNNLSFYGHYSTLLVTNVNNFVAPANASNCLFVIWVCNADFVGDLTANPPPVSTNLATWTNLINQHIANHYKAITNLYAKGMRALVAPNAVDLIKVPQYNGAAITSPGYHNFVRQRIIEFNTAYAAKLHQIKTDCPGLVIYPADIFTLMENVEATAADYGLTNVLDINGQVTSALQNFASPALNGPATNYIWWDPITPSARFNEVIADAVQPMISPPTIAGLVPINGSNRLDLVNMPVGLKGQVSYSIAINPPVWTTNTFCVCSNLTESVFVLPTNPIGFYRLRFPYAWSWP